MLTRHFFQLCWRLPQRQNVIVLSDHLLRCWRKHLSCLAYPTRQCWPDTFSNSVDVYLSVKNVIVLPEEHSHPSLKILLWYLVFCTQQTRAGMYRRDIAWITCDTYTLQRHGITWMVTTAGTWAYISPFETQTDLDVTWPLQTTTQRRLEREYRIESFPDPMFCFPVKM